MLSQSSKLIFSFVSLLLLAGGGFAQQPKLMLPIGSREELLAVSFSPNGKRIVTASADKTAMIWDAATGNLLHVLSGHKEKVSSAEFGPQPDLNNPDADKDLIIVTASYDKTIRVWNAETGNLLSTLRGHEGPVFSAHISPNGKKIVSASADGTVKVWDVQTEKVTTLQGNNGKAYAAQFSSDGKKVIIGYADGTVKLWEIKSGNKGQVFIDGSGNDAEHRAAVISVQFSPDRNKILSASDDSTAKIWDVKSGELLKTLKQHKDKLSSAQFSPDGTKVVTASKDKTVKIWDANEGVLLRTLTGHNNSVRSAQFTIDGKKIISTSSDSTVRIWDAGSGHPDRVLKKHKGGVGSAAISSDSIHFVTASSDGTAKVWDLETNLMTADLKGHTSWVYSAMFSPDGKKIVTATDDKNIKVWDAVTGNLLFNLEGHNDWIYSAIFSPDGNKILSTSKDRTTRVWDINTGIQDFSFYDENNTSRILFTDYSPDGNKIVLTNSHGPLKLIDAHTGIQIPCSIVHPEIMTAKFSPDSRKIITASADSTAKIWDAASGDLLYTLNGHDAEVLFAAYSPDNTKIVTISTDQAVMIWDTAGISVNTLTLAGKLIKINFASFSPDSKKIITASDDKTARIWDLKNGKLLATLDGHADLLNTARFDSTGKKIITASGDNTVKIWNADDKKLLYTFFAVDSTDYLVVDPSNHFDGTENARNLLYFICGSEIVSLDQVKDDLWIPNLAEDLNKGRPVTAKSLDQLDVCSVIPSVEAFPENEKEFQFTITPGRGGNLGEIILFVNDIEAKRYSKETLSPIDGGFELRVPKDSLAGYFVSGEENWVSLKAYTRNNDISSPEAKIDVEIDSTAAKVSPNLYALIVGTSTYKEDPNEGGGPSTKMDLLYPALDARAVSQTLSEAAKKWLNKDGKEHVFIYSLTTDSASQLKSDKQTIKLVLDSIGKKATANDILLIFLSGHGAMTEENGNNKFYYMTADASNLWNEKAYPEVGISTEELTEWISPRNIRAKKRILILDACHSGQAVNDILAQKNAPQIRSSVNREDGANLIKSIDRLNERSGLFILSASASNKSAFESGTYSHGFLTYSLLRVIKEQPDILEDGKNLNISRWFNAAGKTVGAIAKEEFKDQKTQIFSVTDFNIGEVDSMVMNTISLKGVRPLFVTSNFFTADSSVSNDELDLTGSVNNALREISSKGNESKIVFAMSSPANDSYSLGGMYTKTNDTLVVNFRLKKGRLPVAEFSETGTADNLKELAGRIVAKAIELVAGDPESKKED